MMKISCLFAPSAKGPCMNKMTTQKNYKWFGYKYLILNALSIIPFVPVFIFLWQRTSQGIWDEVTFKWAGIFIMGGIVGLYWQTRRKNRFHCPDCGILIVDKHLTAKPGDPLNFYCDVCDVEWVTGLVAPTKKFSS